MWQTRFAGDPGWHENNFGNGNTIVGGGISGNLSPKLFALLDESDLGPATGPKVTAEDLGNDRTRYTFEAGFGIMKIRQQGTGSRLPGGLSEAGFCPRF
jgi:hypothetical protein